MAWIKTVKGDWVNLDRITAVELNEFGGIVAIASDDHYSAELDVVAWRQFILDQAHYPMRRPASDFRTTGRFTTSKNVMLVDPAKEARVEVLETLKAVAAKCDHDTAMGVLRKVGGVNALSKLPADKMKPVIAALKKKLK